MVKRRLSCVVVALIVVGGALSVFEGCGSNSREQPNGTGGASGASCRAETAACAVTVDCCGSLICVSNACVTAPTGGAGGMSGTGSGTGGAGKTGGATGTGGVTGTGGAPPDPLTTQWAVQIMAPTWTCLGSMVLVFQAGGVVGGSWNCAETSSGCLYRQIYVAAGPCISYAGPATGTFFSDSSIDLSLMTDATHAIGVKGTVGTDRIVGTAMLSDLSAPFTAVLR